MRPKTYTVPFAEIVGPEATELEFDDAADYLVLQSAFARPAAEVADLMARLSAMTPETPDDDAIVLIAELFGHTIVEWHLTGADGQPIPQPTTAADVRALPLSVKTQLIPFLFSFRGRPDPTLAA